MQRGSKSSDPVWDAERIRAATFVRHVEIHDTLGSTNVRALGFAHKAEIELPALVVARLQTAGKGRGRNSWWATEGALTFSLLLDAPTLGVTQPNWPQLSLATAVAVCDGLEDCFRERAGASPPPAKRIKPEACGEPSREDEPARSISIPSLQIKWPNDVLVDGRKICGILIESPGGAAPAKNRLIVGVGININNSLEVAPDDVKFRGIALCDVTGTTHDLQALLIGVLDAFAERSDQLRRQDERLVRAWQRLNLLVGRRISVKTGRGELQGECDGIAEDGALVLDTLTGRQKVYSGSVRLA